YALRGRPPGWRRLCPSQELEQAVPAYRPWPFPEFPGGRVLVDREEDHLGATDQVFDRDIADRRENAAIGRIVAVVAHHEEMPRRHLVDRGVVLEAVRLEIERIVADAVRQRLAIAGDVGFLAEGTFLGDVFAVAHLRNRGAVDLKDAVDHLD